MQLHSSLGLVGPVRGLKRAGATFTPTAPLSISPERPVNTLSVESVLNLCRVCEERRLLDSTQLSPLCLFSNVGREGRENILPRTFTFWFKARECYWYEEKHPHACATYIRKADTRGSSRPRTWHWDPWLIQEAGQEKSRNLGIWFWQIILAWSYCKSVQLSRTQRAWALLLRRKTPMFTYAHLYFHREFEFRIGAGKKT